MREALIAVLLLLLSPSIPMAGVDHVQVTPEPALPPRETPSPPDRSRPLRVAHPVPVDLTPARSGTWADHPAGSVWRLRVSSEEARFLAFKFGELHLPAGAELWFVAEDRGMRLGPLTVRHAGHPRRLGSPIVPGDTTLLELIVPEGSPPPVLRIESVSVGFRDPLAGGFGCQVDVNCPEGAPYQDVKRAVAEGFDGAFVCSGTLVDNVRHDNRYLYLTAAHCEFDADPATLTFFWNYENSGCGTNDATFPSSSGATNLFFDATADVHLLELDGPDLESGFDVYFAGWDRSGIAPANAANISFPDDKPKQLAIENDPVVNCQVSSCPDGFGSDFWRVEGWDVGVTEVGSSGSALLDPDLRVVGVLTGGVGTDCGDFEWDEFAQLHAVWPGLAPHLDPDGTGAVSLPGRDHDQQPAPPPVADGVQGTGMRLGKGPGNELTVTFDGTTCSANRAVMLWGNLGDWSGYAGDVGPGCDLGTGRNASVDTALRNVWFNLVWVGGANAAGHPGFSSAGTRPWSAAGFCSVATDDVSEPVCD